MLSTLNFRALGVAGLATLMLIALVILGSRNLQNFDAALIAYLFGSIFAWFGLVYRYTVWLQRPPTKRYWARGWRLFFSPRILVYAWEVVSHAVIDLTAFRFIKHRGTKRWFAHALFGWGCLLAFAVTFPLTFGWIHFGLKSGGIDTYEAFVFGFKAFEFPLHSFIAHNLFHVLNYCSVMVIVGVGIILRQRLTNAGMIALQTFEGDILPLVMLAVVSLTGLGLTWDYQFMQGKAHQFMAITHAASVILFLLWMPFGKFFHIFQRPAQLGVAVYRRAGKDGPQAVCPHTGEAFTSQMHVDDLKEVTAELGFDFTRADGASHLDLSPRGKRAALAKAHLAAREADGRFFG